MPDGTTVLLELCQRATNLANTNSTRTVEYLSAAKNHESQGFRDLAIHFLEVCQTLWPIQAGLMDPARISTSLPIDVSKELTEKVQRTIDDFNSLDLLLTRLLTYERKKGFSRFTKGLGMMNIDTEILKLSSSLAGDRDTLRMGSLAFRWLLGDTHLPSSMGSAYTSLSNVLKAKVEKLPSAQPTLSKSVTTGSQPPVIKVSRTTIMPSKEPEVLKGGPPAQLPQLPDLKVSSFESVPFDYSPVSSVHTTRAKSPSTSNAPISHLGPADTPQRSTTISRSNLTVTPSFLTSRESSLEKQTTHSTIAHEVDDSSLESKRATMSDTASQATVESMLQLEDMLKSYEYERRGLISKDPPVAKIQPDRLLGNARSTHTSSVNSMPVRQHPKPLSRALSPTVKAALINAVRQNNHQVLEELLEGGVTAEAIAELDLISLCISKSDSGSLRLLLVSGADPNRPCINGKLPLQTATELALHDIVSILLKYGADPKASADQSSSPLLISIATDQTDLLDLYLTQSSVALNELLEDGDSLLVKSITTTSSADLVAVMIEHGADPNKKTRFGKTPLLEALFAKRLDIATILLDAGANSNLAGPKHPLWPATHDPSLLQLMLNRGARPRMAPGIMELATSMNSIETVRILLDHHVDPNIKKDGVYTPLCSAIRDDRADIVALLLQHNADPNVPASEFPAFKCISHNRLHYLPDLIAAGADLNSPKGILEVAVAQNNKEALLYLLAQGVDVNARDSDGHTALTTAIRDNRTELVDILLEKGASPAIRGSGQSWPLTLAIRNPEVLAKILRALPKDHHGGTKGIIEAAVLANQPKSVRLLLAAGFSVEDKTGGVFSPLTTALRERHLDIVRLLLDEAGADINAAGEHLPIVKALRRCRGSEDTEAIKILLQRGADINLVYRGWSGIMQAVERGDATILRLMVSEAKIPVDLGREYEEGQTLTDFIRERDWEEGADILLFNTDENQKK